MEPLDHQRNKRSTYRVGGLGGAGTIHVALPSGAVRATLDDVSARGCGFIAPDKLAQHLTTGSDIVVRIRIGGDAMPEVFTRARVRHTQAVAGGLRVGVEFLDPERLYGQLREPQWRYFNRRQAFRVTPADERGQTLRARFHIPGIIKPRSLPLHDLSSSGLSSWLAPRNDVEFPADRPIRVEFKLPEPFGALELQVRVVHRTPLQGRIRTGFRIDVDRTENVEHRTETIVRYVLRRQQQQLGRG